MNESLSIHCPHCGELLEIPLDVSEGNSEFILDCEVCCRPMTVAVRLRGGDVEDMQVAAC